MAASSSGTLALLIASPLNWKKGYSDSKCEVLMVLYECSIEFIDSVK